MSNKLNIFCKLTCRLFLVSFIFSTACKSQSRNIKNEILSYQFLNSIDIFNISKNEKEIFKDSVYLYTNGNAIIYEFGYMVQSETYSSDTKVKTNFQLKRKYVITDLNKTSCFSFDPEINIKPVKLNCDSFFKINSYLKYKLDLSPDSLISIQKIQKEQSLYKYACINKIDETYPDSTILTTSQFKKNKLFSFSDEIEAKNQFTIRKIQMIYNPIPKGKYPQKIPRREYQFEIREIFIAKEKLNQVSKLFEF
jgi:hypothetical protein